MASLSHFLFFLTASLIICGASAEEFPVGGPTGWTVPTIRHESGSYNHWSIRTRFHVGDSLYFKYVHDSVLVVTRDNYKECNTSDPIFQFEDGETVYQFDRLGFFYFISGEPGHCLAGQRMIVLVKSEDMIAPASSPAGIEFGPALSPWSHPTPSPNSGSPGRIQSSACYKVDMGYAAFGAFVWSLFNLVLLYDLGFFRMGF